MRRASDRFACPACRAARASRPTGATARDGVRQRATATRAATFSTQTTHRRPRAPRRISSTSSASRCVNGRQAHGRARTSTSGASRSRATAAGSTRRSKANGTTLPHRGRRRQPPAHTLRDERRVPVAVARRHARSPTRSAMRLEGRRLAAARARPRDDARARALRRRARSTTRSSGWTSSTAALRGDGDAADFVRGLVRGCRRRRGSRRRPRPDRAHRPRSRPAAICCLELHQLASANAETVTPNLRNRDLPPLADPAVHTASARTLL